MTRRKRCRPGAPTLRELPRTRRPSVYTARPGFCVLRRGGGGPGRATRPSAKWGAQSPAPPDRRTHEEHASAVVTAPWQKLTHKSTNFVGPQLLAGEPCDQVTRNFLYTLWGCVTLNRKRALLRYGSAARKVYATTSAMCPRATMSGKPRGARPRRTHARHGSRKEHDEVACPRPKTPGRAGTRAGAAWFARQGGPRQQRLWRKLFLPPTRISFAGSRE